MCMYLRIMLFKTTDEKINIYIIFHSFASADIALSKYYYFFCLPKNAIMTYAYLNIPQTHFKIHDMCAVQNKYIILFNCTHFFLTFISSFTVVLIISWFYNDVFILIVFNPLSGKKNLQKYRYHVGACIYLNLQPIDIVLSFWKTKKTTENPQNG